MMIPSRQNRQAPAARKVGDVKSHEQSSKSNQKRKSIPAFLENADGSFRANPEASRPPSRKPPTATTTPEATE
jgi:hypothetical protein